MPGALIIGASGQDGHYLTQLCMARGVPTFGAGRSGPDAVLDVSDAGAVETLIARHRPEYVFHLAAESTLAHEALLPNHAVIASGSLNVLEACWRHCRDARVFLAGSGMQFANDGTCIDEKTPFEARSPYAAQRIYATYLARYFRTRGLRSYVGYLFHHDSPLRPERHLSQKIARAATRIAGGSGETLVVGNLSVEKEWNFAGDIVEAIWTLVQQDDVAEAVIGSGEACAIRDWVRVCFEIVGLDWQNHVKEDGSFRPDFMRMVSNPLLIRNLGWRARTSMHALAGMMMANAGMTQR